MTTSHEGRPSDFGQYWDDVLAELASTPTAPEVEEIPLRSTDFATAYGVRLTSIGPYRLYAYLSIPKGDGPFPARYYLPRYGSVVDLVPQGHRQRPASRARNLCHLRARPAAGRSTLRCGISRNAHRRHR